MVRRRSTRSRRAIPRAAMLVAVVAAAMTAPAGLAQAAPTRTDAATRSDAPTVPQHSAGAVIAQDVSDPVDPDPDADPETDPDDSAPDGPGVALIDSVDVTVKGNVATVTVGIDDDSDVYTGLSYVWTRTESDEALDTTVDAEPGEDPAETTFSDSLEEGTWYLALMTIGTDDVDSDPVIEGPFVIDATAPTLSSLTTQAPKPYQLSVMAAATDGGSGVRAYQVVWNTSATSVTGKAVIGGARQVSPRLPAGTYVAHVRVVDKAGNWSPWRHGTPQTLTATFVPGTVKAGAPCAVRSAGRYATTSTSGVVRCTKVDRRTARWRAA